MHEVEQLLKKYEDVERRMLVMDDYDGGQIHMVRLIIEDLKKMMWGQCKNLDFPFLRKEIIKSNTQPNEKNSK